VLGDDVLAEVFEAAVDATAEAVVNALCMATTTVGRDNNVSYALPLDRLVELMGRFGRPIHLPA
jgi:D-aminopeptidase